MHYTNVDQLKYQKIIQFITCYINYKKIHFKFIFSQLIRKKQSNVLMRKFDNYCEILYLVE